MDNTPQPLVALSDVTFSYDRDRPVIDIAAFSMQPKECVFLRGPSGSGKSTLLGLIAGVLTPTAGMIDIAGQRLTDLSSAKRDRHRADELGIMFQLFNLLPFLSPVANVTLPCRFSPRRMKTLSVQGRKPDAEALRLLARLKLDREEISGRRVSDLSVGQQQRVAAARALIGGPSLIIADEPTSALDSNARDAFISLLIEEADAAGAGLLFVSHDESLARHFDRKVDLMDINKASIDPKVLA